MTRPHKSDQAEYTGFLLAFEPLRTEKVSEELELVGEASESFSSMDWSFEAREVVLLVLEAGELSISGAALMERMHGSGGTGTLRMRLRDPVLFGVPITGDSLGLQIRLPDIVSTAERLRRIDVSTWHSLLEAARRLRPQSANGLDELLAKRTEDERLFGDSARIARLVEERDAVGLALDIAGLDRKKTLRDLDTSGIDDASSVLDLLDAEPVHEQDIVRHDQAIFGPLLDPSMRNARFRSPRGREVRVYVYDKKALETVVGVDLLVYQQVYKSFLLLQYKAMKRKADAQGVTWWYSVDDQALEQIEAMDRAEAAIQRQPSRDSDIWDWRLHASPFYFKFCEATRPRSREDSLVPGITLGLHHLKGFLALPESVNQPGRKRIGYANCPRYLNNTQFVDLAREGWIGCDRGGYVMIAQILKANQEGGRRAMLALVDGTDVIAPVDARQRGWRRR